ncbi:MAG TPA: outer membrane beta-barrel protein [Cyclobacteriaceae bacterium]|nr:outer membrane beta-barrel protein [Cyclobacteriaceae bacterium]
MKRLYLIIVCCLLGSSLYAQYANKSKRNKVKGSITFNKKSKEDEKFLEKQWWMGLKGGINLTKTAVTTHYSALSPTNYDPSLTNKEYQEFNEIGSQVALEVTFYFKQLSLSFQPTYRQSKFIYTTHYEWTDTENAANALTLDYEQVQKTEHMLLPLLVKFDLTKTKLRPYLQAGGFIAFLINADKSVTTSGIDYASGGENEFSTEPIIVGAKDLFASTYYGMIAGAGVNYHQGNVRLNLDISYQYGLTNIASPEGRYSNDRLNGVGDVMDDLTMDNIVISIGCLFPLRFLGSGFKSLDKK